MVTTIDPTGASIIIMSDATLAIHQGMKIAQFFGASSIR